MEIVLNNANFSNAGIGQVPEVYHLDKPATLNQSLLPIPQSSEIENGDIIHCVVTIDNVSTYAGTTMTWCIALGRSTIGNINTYESGRFNLECQNGASIEFTQTITKKNDTTNPVIKVCTYNSDYYTLGWHVDYYIEKAEE